MTDDEERIRLERVNLSLERVGDVRHEPPQTAREKELKSFSSLLLIRTSEFSSTTRAPTPTKEPVVKPTTTNILSKLLSFLLTCLALACFLSGWTQGMVGLFLLMADTVLLVVELLPSGKIARGRDEH